MAAAVELKFLRQQLIILFWSLAIKSSSPASAYTGALCNIIQSFVQIGASPWAFRVSIPLASTGTSAVFNIKAAHDFSVYLLTTDTLNPPPYTKYQIVIGGWRNTQSVIRTAGDDNSFTTYATYVASVLNANGYVSFWMSWKNGVLQVGLGPVVGRNIVMYYADPSPIQMNYLVINDPTGVGNTFTYCLDENNFDQMTPINAPEKVVAMAWLLDCGRACMDDPKCQGYAILRNVEPIGSSPCSIYYVISGFINDPQRVSFVIRNATAVRM